MIVRRGFGELEGDASNARPGYLREEGWSRREGEFIN